MKGPAPYSAFLEPLHQDGGALTAWQGWKSRLPTQHWLAWVIVKLGAGEGGHSFYSVVWSTAVTLLKCLSCQAAPLLLWLEAAGSGLFCVRQVAFPVVGFFISRSGIHEAKRKPSRHFYVMPCVPSPPARLAPFRL